jgi:hypothetical protein
MRVNRMVLLIVAGLGMILAFLVVWVVSTASRTGFARWRGRRTRR